MKRSCLFALALSIPAVHVAQAQEAPYVDDRSTAASLVRSLYNAINRKEYGRAWSYFGEEKPAKRLEDYAAGFKDTSKVDVKIGKVTTEGAAGSTFYNIPVAIAAAEGSAEPKVFAGCYTARLANTHIQADVFQPMHLLKGALAPSDKSVDEAVPQTCGQGAEAGGDDTILSQAKAAFIATNSPSCDSIESTTGLPESGIEDHKINFRNESDAEGSPDRVARLIAFPCVTGAYNLSTVYYMWDDLNGLRQLSFATPTFDIDYEEPGNNESKVSSINVTGYSAEEQLTNATFDDKTNTLTSWAKWRGVGDAASNGTWAFRNGEFVLVKFDVDASYNGEIDPETVVDYDTAP